MGEALFSHPLSWVTRGGWPPPCLCLFFCRHCCELSVCRWEYKSELDVLLPFKGLASSHLTLLSCPLPPKSRLQTLPPPRNTQHPPGYLGKWKGAGLGLGATGGGNWTFRPSRNKSPGTLGPEITSQEPPSSLLCDRVVVATLRSAGLGFSATLGDWEAEHCRQQA